MDTGPGIGNRILNGRYELLKPIGGGGMARVYQARDLKLNRLVAVKVLRDMFEADPKFVQRFQREAQAAAGLSHHNIAGIHDIGDDGGLHYIVMDYVQGETLRDRIARSAPLPVKEVIDIALDVLAALECAHRNGLVHRDVKPANVMITPDGTVKVVDFGIARGATDLSLTGTGTIVGTVAYISPEQARGERVGPQSDLYSLGITLYEMLTGKPPFKSDSDVGMAIKHLSEKPVPPRQVNPGIPPQLDTIVIRALEKDPARRFSSAAEMAQALRTISASVQQPTIASPAGANFLPPTYNSSGPNAPTHRMPLQGAMPPPAQPYPVQASQGKSNKDGALWIAGGVLVLMILLFVVLLLPGLLRPQAEVGGAPTALATTAVLVPTETMVADIPPQATANETAPAIIIANPTFTAQADEAATASARSTEIAITDQATSEAVARTSTVEANTATVVDLCSLLPSGEGLKVEPAFGDNGRFQGCHVSDNRRGEKYTFFYFTISKYKTTQEAHAEVKRIEDSPHSSLGNWVPSTAFGDPGFAYEMPAFPPTDPTNPSNTQSSAKLKFARGPYVVTGDAGWKDDANYTLNEAGEIRSIAVSVDGALNAAVGTILPEDATATPTKVTIPGASATETPQAKLDLQIHHMEVVQREALHEEEMLAIASVFPDTNRKYLYFVAKGDRSSYHVFAETLEEHERNRNERNNR